MSGDPLDNPHVRAVLEADAKRFPTKAEFADWRFLAAWTLEEATALSMGIDPHIISQEIINRCGLFLLAHSPLVKTKADLLRVSLRADLYDARLRYLERACGAGEILHARRVDDTWEVRPLDFLAWFERQGGRYPWNELHPLFVKQMRHIKEDTAATQHIWTAAPRSFFNADAGRADTGKQRVVASRLVVSKAGKGGIDFSSLGVSKDQRGVAETWELMSSEMSKPLDERRFETMQALKDHCDREFRVRHHDFEKLRSKAIRTRGLKSWRRGRPKR